MSYNSELQNNNEELQAILDEVNALPPANVSPVVNFKEYSVTVPTVQGGWVHLATLDAETMAHINDPSLIVMLAITGEYSYEHYTGSWFMGTNTPTFYNGSYPMYGYSHRQANETTIQYSGIAYPANNTGTNTSLGGYGIFRLSGNDYYIMPGDGGLHSGTYRLVFTW